MGAAITYVPIMAVLTAVAIQFFIATQVASSPLNCLVICSCFISVFILTPARSFVRASHAITRLAALRTGI